MAKRPPPIPAVAHVRKQLINFNMITGPGTLLPRSFVFLRHGEADWNATRLCVGQADRPLTQRGREQAQQVGLRLPVAAVSVVFHSPLSRAADTARIVASAVGCVSICEPRLIEACQGEKEGCFEADPEDNFIESWLNGHFIPRAEPYDDFKRRVLAGVDHCLTVAPAGTPLMVSHWALHFALAEVLGVPHYELDNCASRRFEPTNSGWLAEPFI